MMKKDRSFKNHSIEWVLVILLGFFALIFAFHLFSFTDLSHRWFAKRVQNALLKVDARVRQSEETVVVAFDSWDRMGDFPINEVELPKDVSLFLFERDTLVYWNDNHVEPKLLRKHLGSVSDTLLSLNCGDYLVRSFKKDIYQFYVFSLVNTHYPLENEFFVNRFLPIFGRHHVIFFKDAEPNSYPLYSQTGSLLSYFSLSFPTFGTSANLSLLVVCFVLMLLCVYLLVLRIAYLKLKKKPDKTVPSKDVVARFVVGALVSYFVFGCLFWLLFKYFFSTGFFIPAGMRLDFCLVLFFLGILLLVTFLVVYMRLYRRYYHDRGVVLVTIVHVILLGFMLTIIYDVEYQKFENQQVQELAVSLSDERDPAFEASYNLFVGAAQKDTIFHQMMLSEDMMDVVMKDYIRSFLFDSVMNKYNVLVTLCNPDMELVLQPHNMVRDCDEYFLSKVSENHGVSLGNGLYFVDYNTLDPNYLGAISISLSDSLDLSTLYLEFSRPIAPQGYGLPNTLQDEHSLLPLDYSVACYRDTLLVYKFGSFIFPNYLYDYHHGINEFSNDKKLKHYAYQADESKVVAICLNRRGLMELTAPFTVFFLSILLVYLLVYLVSFRGQGHPLANTLSRKYQMLVLVALGISFLVVGPVSVFYLKTLYDQKTNDFHFERTRTLLLDITGEVDFSILKMPGFNAMLDEILRHYSETFFTDINIYELDGKMLATTTPEMIDLRLQSSVMDPEAFHNMHGEKTMYFIHEEHLGKAVYQSAYIAIQDDEGNTMAYLNTPYFTSKSAFRSEIINYILTYINIIILIILASLPLVLFYTRKNTYPLTQLQARMQEVDINKRNEPIDWQSNDEIGALIKQYNQLVVALEKSAAELRRTATEKAWRSVARQVAHEIKNSLTPMRLSVQMLQRSIENGATDLDERTLRTSKTLIEQIDALSDIASSFSTYAKLPENHPAPLDLAELLGNLVHLYGNEENIEIHYAFDPKKDYTYNGDKTNLNSAIGNILKNAVQAIGSKHNGRIDVMLKALGNHFVISIKDNGKGIKEEYKNQIFLPNFTTKSGGSGVGLSLAYNVIQASGGTITFESQEGVGTEFVVDLRVES